MVAALFSHKAAGPAAFSQIYSPTQFSIERARIMGLILFSFAGKQNHEDAYSGHDRGSGKASRGDLGARLKAFF